MYGFIIRSVLNPKQWLKNRKIQMKAHFEILPSIYWRQFKEILLLSVYVLRNDSTNDWIEILFMVAPTVLMIPWFIVELQWLSCWHIHLWWAKISTRLKIEATLFNRKFSSVFTGAQVRWTEDVVSAVGFVTCHPFDWLSFPHFVRIEICLQAARTRDKKQTEDKFAVFFSLSLMNLSWSCRNKRVTEHEKKSTKRMNEWILEKERKQVVKSFTMNGDPPSIHYVASTRKPTIMAFFVVSLCLA